jgi:hypothetical protein
MVACLEESDFTSIQVRIQVNIEAHKSAKAKQLRRTVSKKLRPMNRVKGSKLSGRIDFDEDDY